MSSLSIKTRLLVMLLGVSVISIAAVSSLNFVTSYEALRDSSLTHLTSVRASRAHQMRQGFEQMRRETKTLGSGNIITDAAREFIREFRELESVEVLPEWDDRLRAHYAENFLPELVRHSSGTPELATYLPLEPAARFLQYHFIAGNSNPIGNKDALLGQRMKFEYAQVHAQHHPAMRAIASNLYYSDLLIIDIETANIVYTMEKEADFGTSLNTGPYAQSNLAELFRRVQKTPDRGVVHFSDFARYRPSLDRPAAFFATPIMDGSKAIAVLAARISIKRINTIMTGGEQWERDGLGKTGETVLVGPDNLLRSASRFLIEDRDGYAASMRSHTVSESTVLRILDRNSPVLEQPVNTRAANEALHGRSGTGVITDYRGIEILGSWAPLGIDDINWAIVAKMDLDEAYQPIRALAKETLIYMIILLLLITVLVMLLANSFVRPVNDLISRARRMASGDMDVSFDRETGDEIGELSQSFRELGSKLVHQTRALEVMTTENQKILEAVMPRELAQRMSQSGGDISEKIEDVSVVFAELKGLAALLQSDGAEGIAVLKSLVAKFDEAATHINVEKIRVVGDTYMATCGLTTPFYDHTRRAVEFSRQLQDIVQQFTAANEIELDLIVGVGTGPVYADVSHNQGFMFHLWGETIIQADHARDHSKSGRIVVTQAVYDRLKDLYHFDAIQPAGDVPLWVFVKEVGGPAND